MKTKFLYGLLLGLVVLTAPWPFVTTWSVSILGLPPWAFYSLCMTVVFAVAIFFLLQYAWDLVAGKDEPQDE